MRIKQRHAEPPIDPPTRRRRARRWCDTERLSPDDCDVCGDALVETWDDAMGWCDSYCPTCSAEEE